MVYYSMNEYTIGGFTKSKTRGKMYDATLKSKETGRTVKVPFGSSEYENFSDKTGLNKYQHLVHGDEERRKKYVSRHKGFIRPGYYSPGYFAMYYLWS